MRHCRNVGQRPFGLYGRWLRHHGCATCSRQLGGRYLEPADRAEAAATSLPNVTKISTLRRSSREKRRHNPPCSQPPHVPARNCRPREGRASPFDRQRRLCAARSAAQSSQCRHAKSTLYFRGIEINYQLVLVFGAYTGTSAGFSLLSPRPSCFPAQN